eukprot:scaffold73_cov252-Pinguiococcus_pyrenoidosus.AAC.2
MRSQTIGSSPILNQSGLYPNSESRLRLPIYNEECSQMCCGVAQSRACEQTAEAALMPLSPCSLHQEGQGESAGIFETVYIEPVAIRAVNLVHTEPSRPSPSQRTRTETASGKRGDRISPVGWAQLVELARVRAPTSTWRGILASLLPCRASLSAATVRNYRMKAKSLSRRFSCQGETEKFLQARRFQAEGRRHQSHLRAGETCLLSTGAAPVGAPACFQPLWPDSLGNGKLSWVTKLSLRRSYSALGCRHYVRSLPFTNVRLAGHDPSIVRSVAAAPAPHIRRYMSCTRLRIHPIHFSSRVVRRSVVCPFPFDRLELNGF